MNSTSTCTEVKKVNYFDILPKELIYELVLPFLNANEINHIALVSKEICNLCFNNVTWKILCNREYKKNRIKVVSIFFSKLIKDNRWKDMYLEIPKLSTKIREDYFLINKLGNKTQSEVFSTLFVHGDIDEIRDLNPEDYSKKIEMIQRITKVKKFSEDKKLLFCGEIVNNEMSGYGERWYSNGDYYKGYFLKSVKHGRGRYLFRDESEYDGEWNKGRKEGQGKYVWGKSSHSKGDYFIGQWKNDKRTGHGKYVHKSGISYTGDFHEGNRHGIGIFKYKDGSYYTGEFLNSRFNGRGKLVVYQWKGIKNVEVIFEGFFSFYSVDFRSFSGIITIRTKKNHNEHEIEEETVINGLWVNGINEKWPDFVMHIGYYCRMCNSVPIAGYKRYKCLKCWDFVICQVCHDKGVHPCKDYRCVDLRTLKRE